MTSLICNVDTINTQYLENSPLCTYSNVSNVSYLTPRQQAKIDSMRAAMAALPTRAEKNRHEDPNCCQNRPLRRQESGETQSIK